MSQPEAALAAPAASRSRLFALLSAAYRYPAAHLGQRIASGQFQAEVQAAAAGLPYSLLGSPELKVLSPESRGSTQDSGLRTPQDSALALVPAELALADLEAAYTHLFDVGSVAGPPCSLYEGEYGGGRVGVMEDVLRFYRFFGLRLSPEPRERPDHLATELEFLHWLASQEARALVEGHADAAQGCASATRDFLAAHALDLAQQVAGRVARLTAEPQSEIRNPKSEIPFYPGLARLAAEFCARDLEYLSDAGSFDRLRMSGGSFDRLRMSGGSFDRLRMSGGPSTDSGRAGDAGRVGAAALKGGPGPERSALQGGSPTETGGPSTGSGRAEDGPPSASRLVPSEELELRGLRQAERAVDDAVPYDLRTVRTMPLQWDRVVKSSHQANCWYQRACCFNLYVCDGIVLREEQVGTYPAPNDPTIPDPNPRGCQKGACYAQRTYDPARVKYPLKRVGERGEGRWQRIGWDQALAEIADQVLDVLATDGPEAIIQGGGTHIGSSEGMGPAAFFEALGCPLHTQNTELGDDHQGAAITLGKAGAADSPDNWFYADVLLLWGGNPAYTNIPNFHYVAEARYTGVRVIAISPDLNASAIHADLWVPVNIGTDAALALSMAQVILQDGLFKADFVREQTDLPLLVRADNGRLLRERDLKRGGREDTFYLYDLTSGQVAEAPRKSLALGDLVPALEGEYQVQTLQGQVAVRPVFEFLREHVNARFTPGQAASLTGVPAALIEQLAREFATARGVVNVTTANWGKFYHGDLLERAIILLFALCGHMGRKGASLSGLSWLACDTALGALEGHGQQALLSAAGADPRYAGWKEDGYTTEMILYEYAKDSVASGAIAQTSMVHYVHGGLLELSEQHNSWDPHLKRPVGEYVREALAKGWQVAMPPPEKPPRIMFQAGGNVFRRGRATRQMLENLLPKLRLLVTIDWRMSASGLYSDYILPASGWYERNSTMTSVTTETPFIHVNNRAVDSLYESLSDWTIFVRLARALSQRARERGVLSFVDRNGKERRLDRLEDAVTAGGLYAEDDDEGLARDTFVNATNLEPLGWEEFKERGFAAFTALGTSIRSIGNACDLQAGEPIVPLTWHTDKKEPYPTLTRRVQFYLDHDWYLELGEHLPTHKDCPKAGGDYPLQVTGGHARWSIHSDWTDNSLILALQRGEPTLFVSAQDAAARGVQDGDAVEVYNDVGGFRVQAVVSPAVRPGQVIIYHGWENYQFEGWRHFKSVMASPLNPVELAGGYGHIRPDPLCFSPGLSDRDTRVEVRRVGSRQ